MKDRDVLFHQKWLGLAQPVEGLVFSVPVLADAQIAPEERADLSAAFATFLDADSTRIRSLVAFFRDFLGYSEKGMLVGRAELPDALRFYAAEGQQEIRPSYALGRGPFVQEDPFADFAPHPLSPVPHLPSPVPRLPSPDLPISRSPVREISSTFSSLADEAQAADLQNAPTALPPIPPDFTGLFALIWDLTESGTDIDLDEPEAITGPWRYPPTAKFERLLRHVGIPIGFLFNGQQLRLVYAPNGESAAHLTFRVEHIRGPEGRPLLAALELLLHARRAYTAAPEHTLEGLLAESRRRQADVTEELAKQVFEAVEVLLAGFESAATRDCTGDRHDWLRRALEAENDHFYQGVLSIVLRLVFLLYAEDQSLLPVEHSIYAQHLGIGSLYSRLVHDVGAHPESMHHRFGAYGRLLALFRAVFFGVRHGTLELPARRGKLFDPNTYPFLEGGLPGWTAAVTDPAARAAATPPSIDDGTIYRVLHGLVVFAGQRLSYRTLDVVQIGSVYESLMGYHVLRMLSPAVRMGKLGVWVETETLRAMSATDRARYLKETCGLNPGPVTAIEKAVKELGTDTQALAEVLATHASGRKGQTAKHRADAGKLVLQPGEERRRTGTHYTPPSLTEKVVRRTLEPLLACLGAERSVEQLLQLKICDPAMGSGAFLVAACRALASEIVAAWTRAGKLAQVIEIYGDAHLHARRLVAQQCLYGVDKNAAAVELAKLSLWLVTLSRTLPFTFVDHALRHGDSLVGLDFKQIESFHWAPEAQLETVVLVLRDALDQAVELRQQLLALADHDDAGSQGEKRRLFDFSQQAIERVRVVADVCVGAFFAEQKDAAREKERRRRADLVQRWLGRDDAEAGQELETLAADVRAKLVPFHWWIEFPEVFFQERPDPLDGGRINGAANMDAFVGNPPFLGGKQISGAFGNAYRDWLLVANAGTHGNGDLSAHFFRRAGVLAGKHGTLGLIATNTIAQGDTRAGGLQFLVQQGFIIYETTRNIQWPGPAAVTVTLVHLAIGNPAARVVVCILDGRVVRAINSLLRTGSEQVAPAPLVSNEQLSSVGSNIYGEGFVVTDEERDELRASNPSNLNRIFPYIGGEEVNTSPTQQFDRYVISFHDMTLEEAARWPSLLKLVEERVRPGREKLRGDNNSAATLRKLWWRYQAHRPDLYAALAKIKRCLVTAQVTKHLCFSFQPIGLIFSQKLCVFPLDQFTSFAVLQSRTHEPWAWLLSSTLETRLNYSASDCFENFPFPQPDPRTVIPELETIGETLYNTRAQYMVDTNQGLTKTYNALKDPTCDDPRILALRTLHEDMDRAVLAAYGWQDVPVPPYCPLSDTDKEAVQVFEDEVIDRLYVLNAERAREEQRLGLGGKKRSRATNDESDETDEAPVEKKAAKGKKGGGKQGALF